MNKKAPCNHTASPGSNGSIVLNQDVNDYDGRVVTAIEKSAFGSKLWNEIGYEVLPTEIIQNGEE